MSGLGRIGVFCGSSQAVDAAYLELAAGLGTAMAERGIGLVYGGGDTGLMGAVAAAVMSGGGNVTGVLPADLFDNGITGDRITNLELVGDMHERKSRMYELSDGFIGLPGGLGTFEEIFEAATWSQLGLHTEGRRKPVALLGHDDYWQPVQDLLDRAEADHFMSADARSIVCGASSIDDALDRVAASV
ncbi:MAG: TIGR00730 family Rossman fold protein [Actinomycetota bacterium]